MLLLYNTLLNKFYFYIINFHNSLINQPLIETSMKLAALVSFILANLFLYNVYINSELVWTML